MFTGIVETKGKVADRLDGALVISSTLLAEVPIGASVSISGACLTVVETSPEGARFDVVPETFARTSLGGLRPGDEVNLELAMPATGRFDGHIVQGHVDGTGQVVSLDSGTDGVRLTISARPDLIAQIVEKGSITIDGVSLTVTGVNQDSFEVALIPHTLELTTLGSLSSGDTVNLETDILAKYVARLVGK